MRTGKISSYLEHSLVPVPDDASFVFLYQLAGSDTIYAIKADGTYYQVGGGGGGPVNWGDILGDIVLQGDLWAILGAKADLVGGIVPSNQLPSYVDDVLNGTYINSTTFNDEGGTPYVPETGIIYVSTNTNPAKTYRWSGSAYVLLTEVGISANAGLNALLKVSVVNGVAVVSMVASNLSDNGTTVLSGIQMKAPRLVAGATDLDGNYKLVVDGISLFGGSLNLQEVAGRKIEFGAGLTGIELEDIGNNTILKFKKAQTHRFTDNNDNELLRTDSTGAYQEGEKLATENWVSANFLEKPIAILKAALDILITNSELVEGQTYYVPDFGDSTNMGIVVVATSVNTLSGSAKGGFLNADFQGVGDYDTIESVTGIGFKQFNGIWTVAVEGASSDGDVVIYNNLLYQVIDESAFNTDNPPANPTAYYCFTKAAYETERVGYIQKWDDIDIDYSLGFVLVRFDAELSNAINRASFSNFQFGNSDENNISCVGSTSTILTINQIGTIDNIEVSMNSSFDCSLNEGIIKKVIVNGGGVVTAKLSSGREINTVRFSQSSFEITLYNGESILSKFVDDNYSTIEGTYNINGDSSIDLSTNYKNYLGFIRVITPNGNETITSVINYGVKNVTFTCTDDCDLKFENNGSSILVPAQCYSSTALVNILGNNVIAVDKNAIIYGDTHSSAGKQDSVSIKHIGSNISEVTATKNFFN